MMYDFVLLQLQSVNKHTIQYNTIQYNTVPTHVLL